MSVMAEWFRASKFKFWLLTHRSVGPGSVSLCKILIIASLHLRVEIGIVYEKAFGALVARVVYSHGSRERLKECYWPSDQGTNVIVKRIETVIVKCTVRTTDSYYYYLL